MVSNVGQIVDVDDAAFDAALLVCAVQLAAEMDQRRVYRTYDVCRVCGSDLSAYPKNTMFCAGICRKEGKRLYDLANRSKANAQRKNIASRSPEMRRAAHARYRERILSAPDATQRLDRVRTYSRQLEREQVAILNAFRQLQLT